jgi:hypothetical protein
MDCRHEELWFNSGDYYINCWKCGASWMRRDPTRGNEYREICGEKIGAAPELANQGFYDPWPYRHRLDESDQF